MSFADLRSSRKSKEAKSFLPGSSEQISLKQNRLAPSESEGSLDIRDASKEPTTVEAAHTSADVTSAIQNLPIQGLPPSLEIRQSEESGRGVYAKEDFDMGEVLISSRARVAALSTPFLDTHCSSCAGASPESGLKRCTRCRVVWYCDSTCQNHDWSLHKNECIALQSWAAAAPSPDLAIPSDAVRCIGRILWGIQKKGLDSSWAAELNAMQSHRGSLQPSTFESHTHLAHSIVRYLGASSSEDLVVYGLSSAGDLVDLISRFTTNAFTLTSFSLTPIGVCYSPILALANHSCDPNAVIVFPRCTSNPSKEPNMQLIAIKPIVKGEQILTSYVDCTLPRELRHKTLRETYNFDCKCSLCNQTGSVDLRSSLWCPKACGGVCPTPVGEDDIIRCSKCRSMIQNTEIVLDALRIGQEALDKASRVQLTDPAKATQLTTNIIPILTRAGLTPSSHPLLAMTRLHQELLISSLTTSMSQELLDQAIQTAAKYTTGLSDTLTYGHPVRAVALAELGKLLAVDEPAPMEQTASIQARFPPSGPARLKMAYETLLRARNELLIGFGTENEGGRVGREVREILVRLERELGIWTEGIRNALEDTRAARGGAKSR